MDTDFKIGHSWPALIGCTNLDFGHEICALIDNGATYYFISLVGVQSVDSMWSPPTPSWSSEMEQKVLLRGCTIDIPIVIASYCEG